MIIFIYRLWMVNDHWLTDVISSCVVIKIYKKQTIAHMRMPISKTVRDCPIFCKFLYIFAISQSFFLSNILAISQSFLPFSAKSHPCRNVSWKMKLWEKGNYNSHSARNFKGPGKFNQNPRLSTSGVHVGGRSSKNKGKPEICMYSITFAQVRSLPPPPLVAHLDKVKQFNF